MAKRHDWTPLFERLFTMPRRGAHWIKNADGTIIMTEASSAQKTRPGLNEARLLGTLNNTVRGARIVPGMPFRLRAARLMAQMATAERAAEAIGVQGRYYRAVEAETQTASPRIIERSSEIFGVSSEYLLLGICYWPNDEDAKRIALVLEDLKARPWSDDREIGDRLKDVRRSAGFRTAEEALARFGWKPSAYRAHEAGLRNIPMDRLIVYAEQYKADARMLAFGEFYAPPHAPSTESSVERSKDSSAFFGMARLGQPKWPWLAPKPPAGGMLTLDVLLHLEDGRLEPAPFPLIIPASGGTLTSGNEEIYAVLARTRRDIDGQLFLIVRRYKGEPNVSDLVASDGRSLLSNLSPSSDFKEGDPLKNHGTRQNPLILGRQIGEVRLRWSSDA